MDELGGEMIDLELLKEQEEILKNNAALVLKPKFVPLYPEMLYNGYSLIEAVLFGFIEFFLSNNKKFYCTNEQLAELFNCNKKTISNAIKNLEKRGDIKIYKKMKAGGGLVRFVTLERVKNTFSKVKKSDGIYNKIIDNNISISKDIDNISNPQIKISGSIKQKINITPQEQTPLPGPLPEEVQEFLKDSYEKYPSTKYQIDKQGNNYFFTTIKDLEKLDNEYGRENVRAVLRFIKQDDFRCKQIQSIGKLRKKNKDGIPYMVIIMDKLLQSKPKIIDLDQYK